jgi:predicted dinucleotide-binding enzyme
MTRSNEVQAPVPEIGILGTGRMGVRLAAMFARAGRQVVLGSRDPARAAELTARLTRPLRPGSYDGRRGAGGPAGDLHP